MAGTFKNCQNLKEINGLNNLETNNVLSMFEMFNDCINLETLDVGNFDTRRVCDFKNMFRDCKSLKEIKGLNNLNTNKGINFDYMFYGCSSLTSLDISNFDTRKAEIFTAMFAYSSNL